MQREDVLRIAGEPVGKVGFYGGAVLAQELEEDTTLYTESQLLAVAATTASRSYAAGAEASGELLLDGVAIIDSLILKSDCSVDRITEFCNAAEWKGKVNSIRALPITPTNTEG